MSMAFACLGNWAVSFENSNIPAPAQASKTPLQKTIDSKQAAKRHDACKPATK